MAARYLVRFWGIIDCSCDHRSLRERENWDFLEWRRSERVVHSLSDFICAYSDVDCCCSEALLYFVPVEVVDIEPDDKAYTPFVQDHMSLLNGTFDWSSLTENIREIIPRHCAGHDR